MGINIKIENVTTSHKNKEYVQFVLQITLKEGNVLFNDALNTFYLRK